MVDRAIFDLKQKMDAMIENGTDLKDLYRLSVKLDKLIVKHYKKRGF